VSRERIIKQYGKGCRIQQVRRTPRFRSSLFVADLMQGARLTRILGAVDERGDVTEQSAMDLMHPERLVFLYERLMLLAFALVKEPRSALLLGLGGGAMCRHLQAYLPDCALTIVERDAAVRDLARRFFHIEREIVAGDAQDIVADMRGEFSVVLADLYDGRGMATFEPDFWRDCRNALAPGGCLAVNWAAFVEDATARQEAKAIRDAFAGRSFFLGPRALSENVVQLAPLDRKMDITDIARCWRAFCAEHRLPREDRDVLQRCTILGEFPAKWG
jgi:spermidine synthase